MRLINTDSLELQEFLDPRHVYPTQKESNFHDGYAILSHRWTDMEVSFEEFSLASMSRSPQSIHKFPWLLPRIETIKQKSGYRKIIDCCANARKRGFEWECYIHLADVPSLENLNSNQKHEFFIASSWWTRCWTLQELLAPDSLFFYSAEWTMIGEIKNHSSHTLSESDAHFAAIVSNISQVPVEYLVHSKDVRREASVAQRLSWAASRQATKQEDEAYSLLGLFGIHMPLLYGEGHKAFLRLQKQILMQSNDESIFVWKLDERAKSCTLHDGGVLAPYPRAFKHSGNIGLAKHTFRRCFEMTNIGLKFDPGLAGSRELINRSQDGSPLLERRWISRYALPAGSHFSFSLAASVCRANI
nr:vegetative incompatibility protein het-e-1 [Quercus suber]